METLLEQNSLEDEIALRNLMARYTDAVNRNDGASWINCWADNASWDLMGLIVTGQDNILNLWQRMMSNFEFALLMPSSCHFEVNGNSATGHWYLHEYTRSKEGDAITILSRYQDSYIKENGKWLYQTRKYELIYNGAPDLSGQVVPIN
ncbi:nuclear transport factor 2 family protein [Biformimicrobium ophioploci]|uniref:SnoaL-like domain-containing protein n=1 Tax=Biformimicrobium ophioploci TaxID=3036711 RepID=A0ABQ6M254_9GAMM|nr:nuclear transport factor 2 family protein [Microbulbifer sp. NKW57]GMG88396.1 hypothetical protein MNKW57_27170 [Microbulbifer sp. NKW57]